MELIPVLMPSIYHFYYGSINEALNMSGNNRVMLRHIELILNKCGINRFKYRMCSSNSRSLSKSKFELPRLAQCQSVTPKCLPKPLDHIKQLTFQLDLNASGIQTLVSQGSLESASLQSVLKDINTSLGFSELPSVVGMIQQRIHHLKFLHQRVNELQVLSNTHQQAIDMLQNSQIQIIATRVK
ncbi:Hypothetical_protein [Hexamita inflata]|uniref:Hypothetical_protein n=1 Tax=Hexamita inflata TaxID=28002 RepID=A0AA86NKH9_9EUKA|nr:Hypothetical protein HINF_LOCUS8271 [Hexamita inflata]